MQLTDRDLIDLDTLLLCTVGVIVALGLLVLAAVSAAADAWGALR